jgi:hypothetical protein
MKFKGIALLAVATCLVGVLSFVQGDDKHKAHGESPSLKPFTALAGEWVGKGNHGDMEHEVRIVYKVTAGGSAVVETFDPGSEHEMVTVIHPDGESLLLTHYCMLGNQPQMKATPKSGDTKITFNFVKATNLKSDKDSYMHDVTYTLIDKDTLKAEWTHFDGGKEVGKAVFQLKRKKDA